VFAEAGSVAMPVVVHAMPRRKETRQHRGVRRQRQRRDGVGRVEDDTRTCQTVEVRRDERRAAVAAERLGPRGVERQQDDALDGSRPISAGSERREREDQRRSSTSIECHPLSYAASAGFPARAAAPAQEPGARLSSPLAGCGRSQLVSHRIPNMIFTTLALTGSLALQAAAAQEAQRPSRSFRFVYSAESRTVPSGAKQVRLVDPVPSTRRTRWFQATGSKRCMEPSAGEGGSVGQDLRPKDLRTAARR
jgi:hypothetical protein